MTSNGTNSEKGITRYLQNATSNSTQVDKSTRKWKFSSSEKSIDINELSESSKRQKQHNATKKAFKKHEDTTRAKDHLQSRKRIDGSSTDNRRSQRSSGGFLLPNLVSKLSSPAPNSSENYDDNFAGEADETPLPKVCTNSMIQVGNKYQGVEKKFVNQEYDKTGDIKGDCMVQDKLKQTVGNVPENRKRALDIDSVHIVNLALNLSESRRVASRQAILNPISGDTLGSIDNGNLRPVTQQNHRTTRKFSSRSNGNERIYTSVSRPHDAVTSTLAQSTIDPQLNQVYKYRFSPSTLARSEKAKITIELMAQYQRLLQFIPPLKPLPDRSEKLKTLVSSVVDNSEKQVLTSQKTIGSTINLGRSYNPLQYIRNRKLRARISQSIDGEAQGFGDLKKVSSWVDHVAKMALTIQVENLNKFSLPVFPSGSIEKSISDPSPRSFSEKTLETPAKVKRSRIDWMIDPADLIADLYWLEKGENKKLIEDRYGNTIFAEDMQLRKPIIYDTSREDMRTEKLPAPYQSGSRFNLRIDTDIPLHKSLKSGLQEFTHKVNLKTPRDYHDIHETVLLDYTSIRKNRHHMSPQIRSRSSSRSLSSDGRGSSDYWHAKSNHEFPMTSTENKSDGSNLKDLNVEKTPDEVNLSRESHNYHSFIPELSSEYQHHGKDANLNDIVRVYSPNFQLHDTHEAMPRYSAEYRESTSDSTTPSATKIRKKISKGPTISSVKTVVQKAHNPNLIQLDKGDTENIRQPPSESRMILNNNFKKPRDQLPSHESISSKVILEGDKVLKNSDAKRAKLDVDRNSGIRGFLRNARNPVSKLGYFLWRKDPFGFSSILPIEDLDSEDTTVHRSKVEDLSANRVTKENQLTQESSVGAFMVHKDPLIHHRISINFQQEKSMLVNSNEFELRGKHSNLHQNSVLPKNQDKSRLQFNDNSSSQSLNQERPMRNDSTSSDSSSNLKPRSLTVPNSQLNVLDDVTENSHRVPSLVRLPCLDIIDHRYQQKWWNYNCGVTTDRGNAMNREIARVRTLLMSSGIKAKEIKRRAEIKNNFSTNENLPYVDVAALAQRPIAQVPAIQRHKLAIQIISEDIKRSSYTWNSTSEIFIRTTIKSLKNRITTLQTQLVESLTPMTHSAADEADALSRDLVADHRLAVTNIADQITQMTRRRKARFRCLRRGGWAVLEWVLIGIMWCVWFIVVIIRIMLGSGKFVTRGIRWLFWL